MNDEIDGTAKPREVPLNGRSREDLLASQYAQKQNEKLDDRRIVTEPEHITRSSTTMAAVNSRDKNRLEKRSSRRA